MCGGSVSLNSLCQMAYLEKWVESKLSGNWLGFQRHISVIYYNRKYVHKIVVFKQKKGKHFPYIISYSKPQLETIFAKSSIFLIKHKLLLFISEPIWVQSADMSKRLFSKHIKSTIHCRFMRLSCPKHSLNFFSSAE